MLIASCAHTEVQRPSALCGNSPTCSDAQAATCSPPPTSCVSGLDCTYDKERGCRVCQCASLIIQERPNQAGADPAGPTPQTLIPPH